MAIPAILAAAGKNVLAQKVELNDKERPLARQLQLLTMKPLLFVLNKKAGSTNLDEIAAGGSRDAGDGRFKKLTDYIDALGAKWVIVDARIEDKKAKARAEKDKK